MLAQRIPTAAALFIALTGAIATPAAAQTTLIRNATVIDGTGRARERASVRIDGDRIIAVGQLSPTPGEHVIDAAGLALAPGFIDTHSHHIAVCAITATRSRWSAKA